MADEIRCPMCSSLNPAGAAVCQICGARLELLEPADSDLPDWMRDFRAPSSPDDTSAPQQPESEQLAQESTAEADEDLLTRLSGGELPAQPADQGGEAIDWLSDFNAEKQESQENPAPGLEDLDWLSELPAADQPAAEADAVEAYESAQPAPAGDEVNDLAAWLQGLDKDQAGDVFSDQATQPVSDLGWSEESLRDEKQQQTGVTSRPKPTPAEGQTGEEKPSEGKFGFTDWLKRENLPLEERGEEVSSAEAVNENEPEAEAEPAAPAEEVPAWLGAFAAPAGQGGAGEEPPVSEEPPAEEIPAWLGAFTTSTEAPAAMNEPPVSAEAPSEEVPAWLSEFTAPAEQSAAADEPPVSAEAPGGEKPAWLAEFAVPAESPAAGEESPASEEAPDWLGKFTAPAETSAGPEAARDDDLDSLPDWLKAPVQEEPSASAELPAEFAALFAEEPRVELPFEQPIEVPSGENLSPEDESTFEATLAELPAGEGVPETTGEVSAGVMADAHAEPAAAEVPEWLTDFDQIGVKAPGAGGTGPLPFVDENTPDWLSGVESAVEPLPADAGGPPALIDDASEQQLQPEDAEPFQVELPEWMGDMEEAPAEPQAAPEAIEEDVQLAPAELPGWVEELRPIEAVIPEVAGLAAAGTAAAAAAGQEEKQGPLAGMRGVLAGEELAVRFRKLPTYSARLRVSERQRAHAALLQDVIDMETVPQEPGAVSSQAPQVIYRLVIAVILILALLSGLVFTGLGIIPAPQPSAGDTGLQNLYNQIESLPPDAPVLLAVDYEPGLSGEMRMAASSVLEHLMLRDARMAVVSTVPSGPLLADDLIEWVSARKPAYDLSVRVANLGYLPGGTTSLIEFARRPAVAAPLGFDGQPVWSGPALAGVQNIQDFDLVLVLTDTTEGGRAWVEQVQPLLGDVPLSMVTSAQAGPMLMPYHSAGQVTGLVSGFLGGALYEQRSGRINQTNQFWNSYQNGYLAGILLLILGGVISAMLTSARKPRGRQA